MSKSAEIEGLFISADIRKVNLAEPILSRRAFGTLLGVFTVGEDREMFGMQEKATRFMGLLSEGKVSAWAFDALMKESIDTVTIVQDERSHIMVLLDRTYYFPFLKSHRRSRSIAETVVNSQEVINRALNEAARLEQEGAGFMTAEQVRNFIGVGMTSPQSDR